MTPSTRPCTVLIVDIAGSVALRARMGEAQANHCIRDLLVALVDVARQSGGTFLKSYGDDVIATFEDPSDDGAALAAEAAIAAQRCADRAGLQLYAGLCAGPVEFTDTAMGQPDAYGQAINLAARLHKLVEDAPGRIFLPAELAQRLPEDLASAASPFGARHIKGYGVMEVWTLSWREHSATVTFVPPKNLAAPMAAPLRVAALAIRHRGARIDLDPASSAPFVVGRSANCSLQVPDPEPRISSRHLTLETEGGAWIARDVSRNGCWVRDARTGEEFPLLPGARVRLPARGAICLGRSFAEDLAQAYVLQFETVPRR
jgi:adenylate cyclase